MALVHKSNTSCPFSKRLKINPKTDFDLLTAGNNFEPP